jgi:two-component system cell cycle response regulator
MTSAHLDKTLAIERAKIDSGRLRKIQASLVVLQGAEIGRDFRLRRGSVVIGRGLHADVAILDDLVSREHARLEAIWDEAAGTISYHLYDLGSTNHTFVDSHAIDHAVLKDGDKIQVGETVLKFVLLDDIEAKFHEEVRNRINYDRLTGLLTKESLYLALEQELRRCQKYDLPLAVLMMDLDHFKAVNDGHGHLMGSHVLQEVGRLIHESTRAVDVTARYGGEEFVAYLPEATTQTAHQVAERIRTAIERHPFTLDGATIRVTISIGIAFHPEHGRDIRSLVSRADRALYRAKETGRNRVSVEPRE